MQFDNIITGYPVDALREPEFAEYQVMSVMPAYPIWLLETPGGIATLTVICVVAAVLLVLFIVILAKLFKLCCFKENK